MLYERVECFTLRHVEYVEKWLGHPAFQGPAIPGAVLGATVVNTELSALLLGVGVGAIAQVIVQITRVLRPSSGQKLGPETIGAITAGVLVMYLTGLLVAA